MSYGTVIGTCRVANDSGGEVYVSPDAEDKILVLPASQFQEISVVPIKGLRVEFSDGPVELLAVQCECWKRRQAEAPVSDFGAGV